MTTVITLDPGLKKLIDELELPQEDPDKFKVQTWLPWCRGRHWVPLGEYVTVNFGIWYGPKMLITSIPWKVQYLGFSSEHRFDRPIGQMIYPYDEIAADFIITKEW